MEESDVERLAWTNESARHIRRHGGSVRACEQVLANQPRFFANKEARSANYLMIGPDARGRFWTVAISYRGSVVAYPVTCWPSKNSERRLYEEG